MSNHTQCPAGIDNHGLLTMDTIKFHKNLIAIFQLQGYEADDWNFDRCRRVKNHAGYHIMTCGGVIDRESNWLDNWTPYYNKVVSSGEHLFE